MSRIYNRNCNQCQKPYKGYGAQFCSTLCADIWKIGKPTKPLAERFWAKVDIEDLVSCWLWTASKHIDGYGTIVVDGKYMLAHRLAWQLCYGPIPKGKCVLHKCDNPPCVGVHHLFLGTQSDNVADMVAKGRQSTARGERNALSKLTESDVLAIRALGNQNVRQIDIAKQFGVKQCTVSSILLRQTWAHI